MARRARKLTAEDEHASRVIRFIERNLRHSKGEWAGRPFELAAFQKPIVGELFGARRADGTRQYRKALIGFPRKNGKSTLAAALALYLMAMDGEPGAEVYSGANDKDQARIVFGEAKRMVEGSPALARFCDIYRDTIVFRPTGSFYRVLSADVPTKHGLNPHGIVYDEIHAAKSRDLWDVLTTAQAARRQPMTIAITTAGNDRTSICWELYEYGRKIERGEIVDPSFYFKWIGAPDTAAWDDPDVWRAANPLLAAGVLRGEFFAEEARQAAGMPGRIDAFRQLFLNQWTETAARWLDLALWDASAGHEWAERPDLTGRDVYGGLDIGAVADLTSLVWVAPGPCGGVDVVHRSFVPESLLDTNNPKATNAALYRRFVQAGVLEVTPGAATDYAFVRERVIADAARYKVRALAIDWQFQGYQLATELTSEGIPVQPMRQGFLSMGPAVSALERRLRMAALHHAGDPLLRWSASHAGIRRDPAGNAKIDKSVSEADRVDPLVALAMAVDRLERSLSAEGPSVYADSGRRPGGLLVFG